MSGHHEGGESRCLEVSSGPAAIPATKAASQLGNNDLNPVANPDLYAQHGGQVPEAHTARTLSVDGDVILRRTVEEPTDIRCAAAPRASCMLDAT